MSSNMALLLVLPALLVLANCKHIDVQDFSNVKMHDACKDKYYCLQKPADYPEERIEKLIMMNRLANIDSAKPEHRQNDNIISPCKAKSTNTPIYQIRDENNKVRYVVQSKRFEQIIRLEWCENKGNITKQSDNVPFDIEQLTSDSLVASCQETYTNYKFLVLSLDGHRLEAVMVGDRSIPVCCKCNIQDTFEY